MIGELSLYFLIKMNFSKPSPQGPTEIPKIEGLAGKENHFVGLFGVTGLTASIGMHVHGNLKEGQTVLVSGAAGATGSVAGQYALRKGAKNLIGKISLVSQLKTIKRHLWNRCKVSVFTKMRLYAHNQLQN